MTPQTEELTSSAEEEALAPKQPRREIVVNLTDYSPLEGNDSVTLQKVQLLLGESVTEETYIPRFCAAVQQMLLTAPSENILLLNEDASADEDDDDENSARILLFKTISARHWVQGYTGLLRFSLAEDPEAGLPAGSLTINIRSRFDSDGQSRFLLYMFEHTMGAHGWVFHDMQIPSLREDTWDLLLATAFIHQLHEAMKKGMLRQYRDYDRNDARVNGSIDIPRHIRQNIPFLGKVAYRAREYVVDNPINLLILRAVQHLESKHGSLIRRVISHYPMVQQGLALLKTEIPDWQSPSDTSVLLNAKRKVANSVYRAYEPVRKTAAAILNQAGANAFIPPRDSDSPGYSVSGFLLNMPKLWEEFLYNAVFREYLGTSAAYSQKGVPILGGARNAKPDFLLQDKGLVLDAKYKDSWGRTLEGTWTNLRDDTYQIISYALIFDCTYCGVIFPVSEAKLEECGYYANDGKAKDFLPLLEPVPISDDCPNRYFIRIPYVVPRYWEHGKPARRGRKKSGSALYREALEASNDRIIQTLKYLEKQAKPPKE